MHSPAHPNGGARIAELKTLLLVLTGHCSKLRSVQLTTQLFAPRRVHHCADRCPTTETAVSGRSLMIPSIPQPARRRMSSASFTVHT